MYKRFLMLSLTLLLGAFLLAGCGEDKTDSSKTETTTVSATQTTTAAETKAKSEPTAAQNAPTAFPTIMNVSPRAMTRQESASGFTSPRQMAILWRPTSPTKVRQKETATGSVPDDLSAKWIFDSQQKNAAAPD